MLEDGGGTGLRVGRRRWVRKKEPHQQKGQLVRCLGDTTGHGMPFDDKRKHKACRAVFTGGNLTSGCFSGPRRCARILENDCVPKEEKR